MLLKKHQKLIALSAAILISCFLLLAIYGKLFHPSEKLKKLEYWVSFFEIFFIISLFVYRNNWHIWVITAVIFASFAGYSIFWYSIKLPCACMGTLIPHASSLYFFLDLIFFVLSLSVACLLQIKRSVLYFWTFLGCIFFLIGYAFAEKIYQKFILL
ncbi:hypothetical protein [Candidatus Rhabdochlamydia sp. T3358]|uniref:hypothetical protein n=1 Tax=Candidatus Rhabdochlamydia sp. T3358 TaxID=2099795 RepID=UPI0010B20E38|nr:hypothetical protein [Candidatus Rhabdochlamydia sp. T3358]VHO04750.1 hypothetical protein RHT_01507 [Candidatus Rhabdochlamydia sp. T3358]